MLNLVLFGPPGAGKGTQSEKIIEKYGLAHISTGQLLRKHISDKTELGRIAEQYINDGNLAPDDVALKIVQEAIKEQDHSNGFIFDGFPRTVAQAKEFDQLLEKKGWKIDVMIALDVKKEELIKRIQHRSQTSGRADDQTKEKIENRIKIYNEQTMLVAKYYSRQGKYRTVPGRGTVDEIFQEICRILDQYV